MRGAQPRVLRKERPRRHLALVDNVNCGEPIVAKAKQQNEALMVAAELGLDIEPVALPRRRTPRKRTPNLNGPVEVYVPWKSVDPLTRLHALMLAGQDIRRCKPIAKDKVVVTNHPGEVPR